jgi:hypothetical protein
VGPARCAYWITSSAVANSVSGMVRPSALAVLRLMTSSSFVAVPPADRLVSQLIRPPARAYSRNGNIAGSAWRAASAASSSVRRLKGTVADQDRTNTLLRKICEGRIHDNELQTHRARRPLQVCDHEWGSQSGRVRENAEQGNIGHQLPEQLQSFRR